MDVITQHPWRSQLLSVLPQEAVQSAIADDNAEWEYIDGEMIKLGSLAHSQVDIPAVQQRALQLLSAESKDFRLFAHLLRTLQQTGKTLELILSVALLADYAENYWDTAWPKNPVHKRRMAQQVLKRFEAVASQFTQHASQTEREEIEKHFNRLQQFWQKSEDVLAKEAADLLTAFRRQPERPVADEPQVGREDSTSKSNTGSGLAAPVSSSAILAPMESVEVDSTNERAWRHTLLKVADLLCERQPDVAIGYRLRRHAIWHTITTAPTAQSDGRTPLAAVSIDRTSEYLSALPDADVRLWQQVEQSLTLAPYWFDGHHISARIADKLGHSSVSNAIREEVNLFLNRVPILKELSFTDRTPFVSVETAQWLSQGEKQGNRSQSALNQDEIWQCYRGEGLVAALQMIEQQAQQEPRIRFYHQLLSAQLMEDAGLTALAQQQYQSLLLSGRQLTLTEWEPSLFTLLAEKIAESTDK